MSEKHDTPAKVHFFKPATCPAVSRLLTDYIVESLSDEAAAHVEQHLLGCAPCRNEYEQIMRLRTTAQALKVLPRDRRPRARGKAGAKVRRLSDYKD
jgi:anti-sigma factor RsiW